MTGLLAAALLPPAGLALLALGLVAAGWRRAGGAALAGLVVLSIGAAPRLLAAGLLVPPGPAGAEAAEAVVVLPAAMGGLLDTTGGVPGLDTPMRLREAAALARRTGLPVLVAGGAMATSLREDFGIAARWVEPASGNLWQSAAAAAALLRPDGVRRILLVTEPWQGRLWRSVFRAAGLEVTLAPATHARRRQINWTSLVPITPAWLDAAVVFEQWAGLVCQAMPGCPAFMRGGDAAGSWGGGPAGRAGG